MYNVHSARPGKCQKSYTNKIVRNQFGVKFPLSTVVKTHIDSNIPIVITSPLEELGLGLEKFQVKKSNILLKFFSAILDCNVLIK